MLPNQQLAPQQNLATLQVPVQSTVAVSTVNQPVYSMTNQQLAPPQKLASLKAPAQSILAVSAAEQEKNQDVSAASVLPYKSSVPGRQTVVKERKKRPYRKRPRYDPLPKDLILPLPPELMVTLPAGLPNRPSENVQQPSCSGKNLTSQSLTAKTLPSETSLAVSDQDVSMRLIDRESMSSAETSTASKMSPGILPMPVLQPDTSLAYATSTATITSSSVLPMPVLQPETFLSPQGALSLTAVAVVSVEEESIHPNPSTSAGSASSTTTTRPVMTTIYSDNFDNIELLPDSRNEFRKRVCEATSVDPIFELDEIDEICQRAKAKRPWVDESAGGLSPNLQLYYESLAFNY